MNTAEFFFGYLCGAVILGVFSWIGIALRIAYTKMDLMLRHLKNSSVVAQLTQLRKGGLGVNCCWSVVFQVSLLFPVFTSSAGVFA